MLLFHSKLYYQLGWKLKQIIQVVTRNVCLYWSGLITGLLSSFCCELLYKEPGKKLHKASSLILKIIHILFLYRYKPSHLTPASSEWSQLLETVRIGALVQSKSWLSLPEHCTSSSTICPVPWPNCALISATPAEEKELLWKLILHVPLASKTAHCFMYFLRQKHNVLSTDWFLSYIDSLYILGL